MDGGKQRCQAGQTLLDLFGTFADNRSRHSTDHTSMIQKLFLCHHLLPYLDTAKNRGKDITNLEGYSALQNRVWQRIKESKVVKLISIHAVRFGLYN